MKSSKSDPIAILSNRFQNERAVVNDVNVGEWNPALILEIPPQTRCWITRLVTTCTLNCEIGIELQTSHISWGCFKSTSGDQSKVVQCIIHVPGRQLLSFLSFILSFATMYVDLFYVIMIYISTLHTCSFLICFNTLCIFIICSTYLQPTRCRRMHRKTSGNIHWTLAAACIRPEVGLPQITPQLKVDCKFSTWISAT